MCLFHRHDDANFQLCCGDLPSQQLVRTTQHNLLLLHVQAQHFTMPAATHGMVDPDGPWRPSTSQRKANLSSQYYPSHPGTERVRSEQHLTSITHLASWLLTSDSWLLVPSETVAAISDVLRGIKI